MKEAKNQSPLVNSLFVLFVAIAFSIWTYFSYNGRFFTEIDQFVQIHSGLNNLSEPVHEDKLTGIADGPEISFLWLKEIEDFKVYQFYVLDSYLKHYPNAHIRIYATKLASRYFAEFVQLGYDVSVVAVTAELLNSYGKSFPFIREWIQNRQTFRHKSSHYDSYLEDLLKSCTLMKKGGIFGSFETILLNPIEKFSYSAEIVFESSLQYMQVKNRKNATSILKSCMIKNFSRSEDELINSPSQLSAYLKEEMKKTPSIISIDSIVATDSKFLLSTDDKHQLSKTVQVMSSFYMLLTFTQHFNEENLFNDNNPFSFVLFDSQLFNRQEGADSFIRIPSFVKREPCIEAKVLSQLTSFPQHLSLGSIPDFGVVPAYDDISSKHLEIELRCKNCDGFIYLPSTFNEKTLISKYNPLIIKAASVKELNMRIKRIFIILNNNVKDEAILVTAKLAINQKSKSAAFPLYNVSNEVQIVTFKLPHLKTDYFQDTISSIQQEYKGITIYVGFWEDDESWKEFPSAESNVSFHRFPADSSIPSVINKLVSMVTSENFLLYDPSNYEYPKSSGTVEKLLFQMNAFDIAAVEPTSRKAPLKNFGFGNFYKNIQEKCLKIKHKGFKNMEFEQSFPKCFPVNFVGSFFLSKTFLFKNMIKWDDDVFKSLNDWGYMEDFFLSIKRHNEVLVGTCPTILALVPDDVIVYSGKNANAKSSKANLSPDAFLRKYSEYKKVISCGSVYEKNNDTV